MSKVPTTPPINVNLADQKHLDEWVAELLSFHPVDAAQLLANLDSRDFEHFCESTGESLPANIVIELPSERLETLLDYLPTASLAQIISDLESDDATAVLSLVATSRIPDVLEIVSPNSRAHLVDGLSYSEDSAGRLMQREFIALPAFWTVGGALEYVRKSAEKLPSLFYEIYVIDPAHRVLGAVHLAHLVTANDNLVLKDITQPLLSDISVDQNQEDVAFQFRKYSLTSAPVKDTSGRLVGMITVDDMVHVLHDEHAEDLLALSNVTAQKKTGIWPSFKGRAPWLLFNLITAIGTSWVISLFETTLDAIVLLAVLMPIIAVVGGNAGNQTLALTIRDLAEKSLDKKGTGRAVLREMFVALLLGFLIGGVLGVATYLWRADLFISTIIAASMLVTIFLAGILGIVVPIGLRLIGADPAVASSVVVLSLTDLIAFVSFLGLASVFII